MLTLRGTYPALVTPFRDGQVDEEALRALVEHVIEGGVEGLVPCGTTGESVTLSDAEHRRVIAITVEQAKKRVPVIAGVGTVSTAHTIHLAEQARAVGADGLLVVCPYYNRPTQAGLEAHFRAVLAAVPLPAVLYNIPGNAGNALTPALVDKLADLDNVVAVKESSGNWTNFHDTLMRAKSRIRVYCGPSSVFGVSAVLAGADGLIDCFPNVWAPGCLDLWHATKAGRLDEAWELQRVGLAMTDLFTSGGRTLYPATKAVMNYLGLPGGGFPRRPLLPLEGEALRGLEQGMDMLLQRRSRAA